MGEPKIVIAGTGRAGTTLLVQILTDLGFDTGYRPGVEVRSASLGGLEGNIRVPDAPRVIKAPGLSIELDELIESGTVVVEHVIIPVRDLDVAAASRVRAAGYGRDPRARGGLIARSKRPRDERTAISEWLATLVVTVAKHDVPHTLLAFPRFAADPEYFLAKLGHLDRGGGGGPLEIDEVRTVLERRYRPDAVHEHALDRSEQRRVLLNTPVGTIKRVTAALRRYITRGRAATVAGSPQERHLKQ